MSETPIAPPRRLVDCTIDGAEARVPEGSTILDACRAAQIDTPTLCWGDTLTPKNACRVCVVEVEGNRALVPSCSRPVTPGMVVCTDTERVRHSRKLVLELLGSSVDMTTTPGFARWTEQYGADVERFGANAATVAQPPKIDNDLYVRDYAKCILCYKCVDACGDQWQGTFAIAVAGRGFESHISTEFDVPLPESACVYCGNCIEVCPTGALSFRTEFDLRAEGAWDESAQTRTDTICPYCGVGCTLTLHVQDNAIVKVTSPHDQPITSGNLCIKGRFGWAHVQQR
ncbi:MAG TPA: 2Fe-2S iron-sulfur cluster-binding protein [Acidimicrobiales bacterium]|jgi:predicted molibdopterin-dependent oxidoreductase YjgC|nr:2Fe-2S iron-sulfur cluster-binding protein [Acidimicrobiales bacterium]